MTVYTERQHLPYPARQLFELVEDVERYPEFMPRVLEVHIRDRKENTIHVDMTIAAGPFRRRFSTVGLLRRPSRIDVRSSDPLFERFEQRWTFASASDGGTNVEYHVDLELRSRALQILMGTVFANRTAATIAAFRQRAIRLYA